MEWKRLDLPAPVLIEARGADALRYLNGQVTQDVRQVVSSGKSLTACVTDAKGRLQFRVMIHALVDGAIRVSCDHEGADGLFARLDRYLIADDAALEDLSGGWTRVHVTGDRPPVVPVGGYAVGASRIGLEGWDVWCPSGSSAIELETLEAWDPEEAESIRIRNGVPAWGNELGEGLLPPEAGLDRTDISYSKGCYIGQEVISRIKSAGKVNRRLMRMDLEASFSCASGDLLEDEEGREAGVITSVAPIASSNHRPILAYLKRSADGERLRLKENPEAVLEIVGRA